MATTVQRIHHETDRGFSAAVIVSLGSQSLVYISGEVGRDSSGHIVGGGFEIEARQCFANIAAALQRVGASFKDVVKITAYLKDLSDYPVYAMARSAACGEDWPASACIGVADLMLGAKLEVDAVAVIPSKTGL
jgi:enamine deaminase RidA (YjgF/YER057c/UK114 family)